MNENVYQRIERNPHFQELVRKRQRFAWTLSLIMLACYLGFILLIAFDPAWLGTPISPDSSITRGIPVGVGIIFTAFILTGIYVQRANGEFDQLNQEILNEVSK
ncbi:MAG: DUF485 domain-containing protein [Plesiomonas sp.]|uniref:DUF485 domain-containing protein n=2 Tax=Plesiomonas sp. TaxID=2486279 RepID=UPI003EE5882A